MSKFALQGIFLCFTAVGLPKRHKRQEISSEEVFLFVFEAL